MTRLLIVTVLPLCAMGADWDARAAARYLDGRAAEWAAWKVAAREGGPCLSCHTSLSYLLARPALRRKLGESSPTEFETGLIAGVKTRATPNTLDPAAENPQKVVAALAIALNDRDRGESLSAAGENALRTLWATQRREGKDKGSWGWTQADLDPWEVPESPFFGAALAAVAAGSAPGNYQRRENIQQNIAELKAYLRDGRERQPFANRLLLLWAARLDGVLTDAERREIIEEAWRKQRDDGGWTIASLGPWREHPKAPAQSPGAHAYATAWTSFLLQRGGVPAGDAHLKKALGWLRAHQDPGGFWDAVSMNKAYEAGSMQERFMRDASTAFAVLALSEGN